MIVILFLAFLTLTAPTLAGDVSFTISDRKTYVGVPIQITVEITNAQDHDPPKVADIQGADVRIGPPANSQFTSIFNGQMEQRITTTYTINIIPRKEGDLVIPPLAITVDDETYTSQPQTITVRKSENKGLLDIKLIGDVDSVYVGEPINVTLEIWLRQFKKNRTTLDFRQMWRTIDQNASNFGQFADIIAAGRDVDIKTTTQADPKTGRRHTYFIYSVENKFWPERPGQLAGSDINVVVNYPISVTRNRFSILRGLSIDRAKPITASVTDSGIIIKAPPTENRPDIYRGAVGQYAITATANPTEINVGDPITITLDIRGTGRLETLQPPPLTKQPQLTNDFRVPDESLAGIVNGSVKTFTQSIRATRDDITEVPPIRFAYFDPDIEEYVTIETDPIPLAIKEQAQLPVTQMVEGTRASSVTNLTARTEGLLANIDDPSLLLANQTIALNTTTLTIAGGMPILYVATLLFQTNRRKLKSNVALGRRRNAKRNASQKLTEAQQATDPTTSARLAAAAITTYIADRCNLPTGGLTRTDAITQLQDRSINEDLVTTIDQLLEECDHIQYAPTASAAANITARTQSAITQLEKENLQ